jgi:1,4-dihydroxy-6-naphthoate synthase
MSASPEKSTQLARAESPESVALQPVELSLAHSPDSDDAFMFYGLATKKIATDNLKFTHKLEDIQSLNQKACDGVYDITAISFASYAHIAGQYILLPSGASFGEGYGPIVVAKGAVNATSLRKKRVAVPGKMTSAYLTLALCEPEIEPVAVPFDQILDCVANGQVDAGVIIHEGQLTYALKGLNKVIDLGEWWRQQTGLPLPLGGNVIRRALGGEVIGRAARVLRASIQYSLDHREEALAYAMQFARGLDHFTADRFVSMYVNNWTLDYGERGREAVQTLLDLGFQKGLLPRQVTAEFAADTSSGVPTSR